MGEYFHEIKILHTLAAQERIKMKIRKRLRFAIVRLSLLVGIQTGGGGGMMTTFSTRPLRVVEKSLQLGIQGPLVRVINDKVIYLVTIDSFGLNFGTPFCSGKEAASIWSI